MAAFNRRSFLALAGGLALSAACRSENPTDKGAGRPAVSSPDPNRKVSLRLGYFPNMTHAQPQVAIARGTYASALGANVTLDMSKSFNAGPAAMEALLAGSIDATFVGPGPTATTYAQTNGKELRIVAGATSGGALLIVRPAANLTKPGDFANRKIASPQIGNTQDVALRAWIAASGLKTKENGGNVTVVPTPNPDIITLFQKGDIDGAWVPEPWATRLVLEAGGKVYLDERSLWPNGQFCTTQLTVRTSYLQNNPDVIENLLRGHVDTTLWIRNNPDEAKKLVNQNVEKVTGAKLAQPVIDAAWSNQEITWDPVATSFKKNVDDSYSQGFINKKPDLRPAYELGILNRVLRERQLPEVQGLG